MADKYAYAAARIRVLENRLLTGTDMGQLQACPTFDSALEFLEQKGWGEKSRAHGTEQAEERMLRRENEKIWEVIRDLRTEPAVFEILMFRPLYHNLKAAVREICAGRSRGSIYYQGTFLGFSGADLCRILRGKDFYSLPEHMRAAAEEALESMLQTGDGQICDRILDRALLDAVERTGRQSREAVLRVWSGAFVAMADLKIAVRAAKAGKNRNFLEKALAPCRGLDLSGLCAAALAGPEAICGFLGREGCEEAREALRKSGAAFEQWCDSHIMRMIQPHKYQAFSVGPLVNYILARENEIRTVRMILTGKRNHLPEGVIRERVRERYV